MTLGHVLVAAYEVERVMFRVVLIAAILKRVAEAWAARRTRATDDSPPAAVAAELRPVVTVQLPIRNEFYVVERVIRAAAALDYPADRLEIQVLDDSDDETVARVDAVIAELRATGTDITVLRRDSRGGAKSGALAFGLQHARGDYIAVFDADFIPTSDFLNRALPAFEADPKIGMVQGRWEFLNRGASVLTRAQALVLDGLMLVEQPGKYVRGQPLHFNGTAGMWRRTCIEDAGGWSSLSITEDLELSYRAIRSGWKMVHLPHVAVPNELPDTMRAYRAQQERWTRGNAQVLRATWRAIVRAKLPVRHRAAMWMRLSTRVIYVFLAILTITMPLTTFQWMPALVNYSVPIDAALLAIVLAALYAFYLPAERRATGSWWRGVPLVPVVITLHVGLSMCCATAFVAGLVKRTAEFVRTPKSSAEPCAAGPHYRLPFPAFAVVELVIGIAYVGLAALAVHRHLSVYAVFFAFWASAHLWTGGASAFGGRPS